MLAELHFALQFIYKINKKFSSFKIIYRVQTESPLD
jgi:hypothetical protein